MFIRSCPVDYDVNNVFNCHVYKNLRICRFAHPRSRRTTLVDLPDYHRRGARACACRQHFPEVNHVLAAYRRVASWTTSYSSPRGTMKINITDGARPAHACLIAIMRDHPFDCFRCVIRIAGNVKI